MVSVFVDQDDYIAHLEMIRPNAIRPVDNTVRPTDPIMDKTEYKVHYYTKPLQKGISIAIPERYTCIVYR